MTTNQATDPMIGRMIDQRYRVRSRIARGGMATVYLATDVRLERRVAIKIMHGHLADDEAFRNRFIQEARSAARLSHPNVVGVFDQGAEDDCTYIVMEYIPGITLRELLQDHRALTPEQALDILRAVLAGLASAHRAGIVHRDLKPENVLLADDGRIKLGDFGLARAATANTATGAALLGTIAYLSPELVTRGVADTRSDIYAVGIMLYEMLTGEQPYKGEQPMQIAYQHANDQVPPPSRANGAVPSEMDDLVLWSTSRDPDSRPRDAREMLDQVDAVARHLDLSGTGHAAVRDPGNATAILPDGGAPVWRSRSASGDVDADDADTTILGARGGAGGAGASAAGGAAAASGASHGGAPVFGDGSATTVLPGAAGSGIRRTGPTLAEGTLSPAAQRLATKTAKRRRRGWVVLAVVLALVLAATGVGLWFGPGPGGNVRIPATAGKSVAEATKILEANGLSADKTNGERFDAVVAKGLVSTSKPTARSTVHKGSTVRLIVSQGPRMITLPALVGQPYSTVKAALQHDFALQDPVYQFDDADKDTVIAATGRDTDGNDVDLSKTEQYGERGPVTLTVSLGPVPDVTGTSQDDATATLDAAGLKLGTVTEQFSDSVADGDVISSSTADDPVVQGSAVDLVVSKGPSPITLPDVKDKTIDQAVTALEGLGLKVDYPDCTNVLCGFYDWKSSLPVTGTDPAAGTIVHKGDTVTLKYDQ